MLYLKTFESYSIKKMYFINEYDVNNTLPYTYPSLYKHKLYSVYDHIYTQYKKGVSHKSTASFNYIYETGNLNLFDFSRKDFDTLNIICKSWYSAFKKYYTTNATDVLNNLHFEYMSDALHSIRFDDVSDMDIFMVHYDGFVLNGNVLVFENIIKNSKLIDGNVKRFGTSSLVKTDLPEHIIDDLIRYTDDAGKRMKKETYQYLLENAIKPKEDITIYRGFGLDILAYGNHDDEQSLINDTEKLGSYLKRRIGISEIKDIHKNQDITISRGKESSWSHNAEIARGFATGMASDDVNILVKCVAKPSDILIDFTLLSENDRKKFKYIYQNEVILKVGKHKSTINDVWISNSFNKYIQSKTSYKYIKGYGISDK